MKEFLCYIGLIATGAWLAYGMYFLVVVHAKALFDWGVWGWGFFVLTATFYILGKLFPEKEGD